MKKNTDSASLTKVYHFLIVYVLASTGSCVYLHHQKHGGLSFGQIGLAFFLCLNILICFWEICLGLHIDHIKKEAGRLKETYKGDKLKACLAFFMADMPMSQLFSSKFWSAVWSTYALYDPSYANKESFGFFIDVGNGWTMLLPSIFFTLGMTYELVSARVLGIIGLVINYQVCHIC